MKLKLKRAKRIVLSNCRKKEKRQGDKKNKNMTRKYFIGLVALGLIVGVGIFHACQKNKGKEVNVSKVEKALPGTPVCCSVECSRGHCFAHQAPCSCSCGIFGHPHCGGGSSGGSSSVYCSEDQLATHEPLAIYLQQNLAGYANADEFVSLVRKIKELFQRNVDFYYYTEKNDNDEEVTIEVPVPKDERYIIPEASIQKYYEYVERLDVLFDLLPASVQEMIMSDDI